MTENLEWIEIEVRWIERAGCRYIHRNGQRYKKKT